MVRRSWVRFPLAAPYCVLGQEILNHRVLVKTQKVGLRPDINEKLLTVTVTLNLNTNKRNNWVWKTHFMPHDTRVHSETNFLCRMMVKVMRL